MSTTKTLHLRLLAAGAPGTFTDVHGKEWTSSIARTPAKGPLRVTPDGIEDDACQYHGHHGPFMALNVFCTESYAPLQALAGKEFPRPAFGENLTIEGHPETEARVGDLLRVGTALLRVTQPREPCSTVLRYLREPRILRWMIENTMTGYYVRVEEPGVIAPDDAIELVEVGHPEWTIHALARAMYDRIDDAEIVAALQHVPQLSPNWKASLMGQHQRRLNMPK